jgi:hypothetical protein
MTRLLAVLQDAAARWRWWHAPLGVALGTWTLVYMGAPLQPGAKLDALVAPWIYNVLQFGLPLVAALLLADAAVAQGARARVAYPVAALAVVVGGVFVIGPALMPWLGTAPGWDFSNDFWLAIGVGVLVGLLTTGHALWRRAGLRLAEARAAEAERLARAQALQGARLAALQARVEPRLLFDALGRVAERIDADTAEADALLADTIAMLRALLPSGPGGGIAALTTLARELELVRLQARLTDDESLGPARLLVDVAPEAAAAAVAPTLVPRWLRALAPTATAWTLHAQLADGLVRLLLVPLSGAMSEAPAPDALADIHAALVDVHGPGAGLAHDDHGFSLRWPLPSPP